MVVGHYFDALAVLITALSITVSLPSYALSLSVSLSLSISLSLSLDLPLSSPPTFFLLVGPLSLPFSHSPWLLPPLSIISHCNHTHTVFLLFLLSHSLSPLYYSFLSPIFTLPLFLYIIYYRLKKAINIFDNKAFVRDVII